MGEAMLAEVDIDISVLRQGAPEIAGHKAKNPRSMTTEGWGVSLIWLLATTDLGRYTGAAPIRKQSGESLGHDENLEI
jgi:hypothetical protein